MRVSWPEDLGLPQGRPKGSLGLRPKGGLCEGIRSDGAAWKVVQGQQRIVMWVSYFRISLVIFG